MEGGREGLTRDSECVCVWGGLLVTQSGGGGGAENTFSQ